MSWVSVGVGVLICLLCGVPAHGEPLWVNHTGDLPDTDIREVMPMGDSGGVLAASSRRLYRYTADRGAWKSVAGVRKPDEIIAIVPDLSESTRYWLATMKTIRLSVDQGRTWKYVFRRDSESGFRIRALAVSDKDSVIVGTTQGLQRLDLSSGQLRVVEGSPKGASVDSIVSCDGGWMIGTSRGIYRADQELRSWELLKGSLRPESESDGDPLGQFSVEEIASTSIFSNAVAWPRDGRVFMGKMGRVYEGAAKSGSEIREITEAKGLNVRRLAADERFIYMATDRGVYQFSPETKKLVSVSSGLGSLDVTTVAADSKSGRVWAGTPKGLYSIGVSDVPPVPAAAKQEMSKPAVLPADEPTISEIQQAAIHYAEVSPDKIQAWRDAASKKAWLPTVSLDTDFTRNQNVDIDRGGTNDPDRFIVGPQEKQFDWSVDFSWDLGDLIWSGDQASIDVRSRLMVELRNDILSDVTHLYFERRRMQAEFASLPADIPKLRLEKEMKLEELTAQIDALTGGFLSKRLGRRS